MSTRANSSERPDGRSFVPTRHSVRDPCDPERRRQASEARNHQARTADHIYEFCRLCDNPVTAFYTVTGLNRHCAPSTGTLSVQPDIDTCLSPKNTWANDVTGDSGPLSQRSAIAKVHYHKGPGWTGQTIFFF